MRIYEELFIVKHDAPEEEIDALVTQLTTVIETGGGKVDKVDKWGVRKLAYKVEKRSEGFYVLIAFHAEAQQVKEVERRLRVADLVIKFLTVRMDEKLKWLEKRQKARAKRAAKKPPPSVAAPAAPAGAAPAAPAVPGAPTGPTPGAPAPAAPAPAAPAVPAEAAPETAPEANG